MNRYETLYEKFSGLALIAAPLLFMIAAVVATLGIGSSTGRWYDSWIEGFIMLIGLAMFIIALLALSRIVGQRHPAFGIITAVLGVVGTSAAFVPTSVRILGAGLLTIGTSIDTLDIMFGGNPEADGPPQMALLAPLLLLYFLNLLLLAFGLWRIKDIPRYSPILLVVGAVLFMVAEVPFEVNHFALIGNTICWLIALAPIGWRMLSGHQSSLTLASSGHTA